MLPSELVISISLRHRQSKRTQKAGPRTTLLEKTDLTPPKDVCRAELKSIRLDLDFTTILQPQQLEIEIVIPSPNDSEIRLPDQKSHHLEDLESTVKRIRSLPLMVSMNFEREGQTMPRPATTITKEDTKGSDDGPGEPAPRFNPEAIRPAPKTKSFFFPEETTQTLRTWLICHADNPFPTASEKQQLMKLTGLNKGIHISKVSICAC